MAQVSYLYLVTCGLGDAMARSLPRCFLLWGPLKHQLTLPLRVDKGSLGISFGQPLKVYSLCIHVV